MQIVIALFDRFTALDAVGPHQVLSHLPGAEVIFAAERAGGVTDESGTLTLRAPGAYADVPRPDILVVPGGPGQSDQMTAGPLRDWLLAADETSTWTTSVCTGSLILGAAGLLSGRAATTYWLALEELRRYGAEPRRERFVFDGKYVTGAGVSAATWRWPWRAVSRATTWPSASSSPSSTTRSRPTSPAHPPPPGRRSSSRSPPGAASPR
jgi:putative intracellular protease/amidase